MPNTAPASPNCPVQWPVSKSPYPSSMLQPLIQMFPKRHALVHWQLYGWGYQGAVAIRRGDIATGLRLLRSCFEELGETGITAPRFMRFAAVDMAVGLGGAGQTAEAFAAIDDAIARAERTEELWQFAEFLRVKGELLLLPGAFLDEAAAEDYFRGA